MGDKLEDVRWLIGAEAARWLDEVERELAGKDPSVRLLGRLRKELSPERAHLVVEQVELRKRGAEKFARAFEMFFTRKGLEQATDGQIARYKASRFPAGAAVADLCCGIGGDLVALGSRRGTVTGVDLDPAVCLLAEANARVHGCADRCQVQPTDAAAFPLNGTEAWHIDPDRRSQGSRTTRIDLFEPSLEAIERMLTQQPSAAIKLAPATEVPATEAPASWRDAEREWIGSRGECRQQVIWTGSLARHGGQHAATIVDGGVTSADSPYTIVGSPDEPIPVAEAIGRYVYEPHSAVLAAQLTGVLCRTFGLAAVTPGIPYLTADAPVVNAALAAFEVQDLLPLDTKQLKAWCRERRIGRLEIKKRGIDIDPERLRKSIIASGDEQATLIVMPGQKGTRVIAARRRLG